MTTGVYADVLFLVNWTADAMILIPDRTVIETADPVVESQYGSRFRCSVGMSMRHLWIQVDPMEWSVAGSAVYVVDRLPFKTCRRDPAGITIAVFVSGTSGRSDPCDLRKHLVG